MDLDRLFEPVHSGEYELKISLREHGYSVKDVSNDPEYWDKDIDLIATNLFTNTVTSLEVKWDRRLTATGNLFIETKNPRSKGGKGWYMFCEADMLAYGDAVNSIFYFIRLADLRNYIEAHKDTLTVRTTADGSTGYIVPLTDIAALLECAVDITK